MIWEAQTAGGALPLSGALTWDCLLPLPVRELRKVDRTEGKWLVLGTAAMGLWLVGWGIHRARWRPPWPSLCQAPPGLSGAFHSVSLSIVSTSGRLVPPIPTTVAARPQRKVPCSSVSPSRPLCPHRTPGDPVATPMSSAHPDTTGREGGGLQLPVGTGPTSAWVLVVKDDPWGRRTRACGQRGLWQPGLRLARGTPCPGAPRMSRIQGKGRSQRPGVRRASVARSQQG